MYAYKDGGIRALHDASMHGSVEVVTFLVGHSRSLPHDMTQCIGNV